MALEQQPLGPVANLLPRGQDEIARLPGLHEAFPPETTGKRLSHSPTLYSVWLEANIPFEGLEKGVFGSVVYLDLFVIVGMLAEPVVWHFSGDWGRLPLVAAADDLDAPTLEEGFQSGAGHCADLVPYDQTGNKLLSHPFGRQVCLAAPAEEAVIWPGRPWPASLWPGDGFGVKTRGFLVRRARSLAWFCRCPRCRLGSSSGASTAGHRAASRCWA